MKIQLDEARRVAALASLEFDEGGLSRVAGEMSKILDYVDQLASADISSVPDDAATAAPSGRADDLRETSFDAEVAANAPSMLHGHFAVPRVIGED